MANELTGDFDVVVEFSTGAANRVLAAMHRGQRFPHSISLRVDDRAGPRDSLPPNTVVDIVDASGDSVADHNQIRPIVVLPAGASVTPSPSPGGLGPLVNGDSLGASVDPIVPSLLVGRAQLQIGAPTLEVAPGSSSRVVVRSKVMSRYLPDANTRNLAEFIRGEFVFTGAVTQIASQVANVIDFDVKASDLGISFTPAFSSRPITAEDMAAINLLIRNALKTSLLPSNTTLPAAIHSMQFKTLSGPPPVIAILLNLARQAPAVPAVGNPGSAANVFLLPADDFAFGVGKDFVLAVFEPVVASILAQPIPDAHFSVAGIGVTYRFSLSGATVALETGQIVLTVQGSARTPTVWLPNFGFTVRQLLTLQPAMGSAELVVGDVSIDTDSIVADQFKNRARSRIETARDLALNASDVFGKVRRMLSADDNLGPLFESLLAPPRSRESTFRDRAHVRLAYTEADIRPSGIVLRGSLAVTDWPAAHAEIEPLPPSNTGGKIGPPTTDLFGSGPDYTAFKSWIPGGTVERYEWTKLGQTQPVVDQNRFVHVQPEPVNTGAIAFMGPVTPYEPYCLTLRGSRLSASGPVVAQPVSATTCGYTSIAILNAAGLAGEPPPMVTLTRPGPGGLVEIAGHATARVDRTGHDNPYRIFHFADDTTAGQLDVLLRAVQDGRPKDAGAAVLAVLATDRLTRARYTPGIVYLEDQGGVWERAFGLKGLGRPSTLIVDPSGRVVWKHEGPFDREALAAAVRKHLAPSQPVSVRALRLNLRIGGPPLDFVFEIAPGRQLTLRKLAGRPVVLAFWKSSSSVCLEALHEAGKVGPKAGGPIVLAINDGEAPETAKRVAAAQRLEATLVADPQRRISSAYGVGVWPTTVFIDAAGLVRSIRYGREERGGDHV